jgi:hypothetical protein
VETDKLDVGDQVWVASRHEEMHTHQNMGSDLHSVAQRSVVRLGVHSSLHTSKVFVFATSLGFVFNLTFCVRAF